MFDVAGIESLAGGRTGETPYGGPDGEKRWSKMKENVIKEWEEEQRNKQEQEGVSTEHEKHTGVCEIGKSEHSGARKSGNEAAAAAAVKESKMDRLKAKLFKH
ncbi:hypothetical protein ACN47E_010229 [Coniothyrium glycines]